MSRDRVTQFILDNLIWFIILLVCICFALITDTFLTGINIINILLHASILGVLTIGQAIVLMSGNFDLSAEGTVSLVAVVAAWLMLPARSSSMAQAGGIGWEVSPFIVVPLMLIIGTVAGWLNGMFITRLRMNNFIVTLAMQLILRGIAYVISMGAIMPGTPPVFNWLGGGRIGTIPVSVIVTLLLFVIFGAILRYTRFGRQLYAVGANRDAALASGFKPQVTITQAYMIGGFMAGLAGCCWGVWKPPTPPWGLA
jgi:ribose/xylose/arabinose/galactoside ABC-type transport system permease subunit